MKKTVLRAYARLIAEVGARVQKGQDVVIEAELDQPEFVTMVADACYHAGARKVTVTWKHQALEKLAIRRESVKTLRTVEEWERAKLQHYVDTLPCRIYLLSEDPDGLRSVSLFGSYSKGTARRDSDVDLKIEKGSVMSLFQLSGLRLDIEDALSVPVDLVTNDSSDREFLDMIAKDEVLLYGYPGN